jgi:predicted esterase
LARGAPAGIEAVLKFTQWLAIVPLALSTAAAAQDTVERTTTIEALFPADTLQGLAKTLAVDRVLHYRVRIPRNAALSGVLIFVKPVNSGELPDGWAAVLDGKNLIWAAANDFGNEQPSAQRVLAAIAALKLIESTTAVDTRRLYIAGMSGGGRIASQIIARFPRYFTGALYIVGADFWARSEESSLPGITANRYVFITGSRDFNHGEMRRVYSKYLKAGVRQSLLMDLPGFAHEYPNAEQLAQAIDFLDARQAAR